MLTEKGEFVLNLIHRGIRVSEKRYTELWEEMHSSPKKTVKICPTCKRKM